MAYVTRQIDWLSFTISQSSDFRAVFPLLEWRFIGRGVHGYQSRYQNSQTLAIVDTDAAERSMGHHFTFSGETLAILRSEAGMLDTGLVNRVLRYKGKSSRIDLTINIHEGLLTPRIVYDALKQGKLHAKANVFRFIEGKRADVSGDTLYIGAPKSDRQFRCYNKAAEAGIVDKGAWLRLELELRRLRANGALQSCGSNGVPETISGHIADFIQWKQHEFNSALADNGVEPLDIPRKLSNRQRWLLGQVSQALAKELILDVDFTLKFWNSVQGEYERLTHLEQESTIGLARPIRK